MYCIFIVLHKSLRSIAVNQFFTGLKILQNEYYYFIGKDLFSRKLSIFLEEYQYNLESTLSHDTHFLLQYYSEHKIQLFTLISVCLALIIVVNNV